MPENPVEVIMERLFERLIGEDVYMSHVWSLLSLTVYLVRAAFDENERMAWMVDIEMAVLPETEQVRNGLPRTRKNLMLEEGMSRVTLRSLWEEIKCVFLASGWVFSEAEMVRSALKIW
jgi:hypothetical protein